MKLTWWRGTLAGTAWNTKDRDEKKSYRTKKEGRGGLISRLETEIRILTQGNDEKLLESYRLKKGLKNGVIKESFHTIQGNY